MVTATPINMDRRPVILHTDDEVSHHRITTRSLARYGIDVDSYSKNEDALVAAQQKVLPNGKPHYSALLADYDTKSDMTGAQLIATLVDSQSKGEPLVGEILVISSSGDRKSLKGSLEKYTKSVQIFNKTHESNLAYLYIALRCVLPDETRDITRADMIRWAGFNIDINGDLIHKGESDFALNDFIFEISQKIQRGELTLQDVANEINPFCHRDEGRLPGRVK